jgi:hypothetical protein
MGDGAGLSSFIEYGGLQGLGEHLPWARVIHDV